MAKKKEDRFSEPQGKTSVSKVKPGFLSCTDALPWAVSFERMHGILGNLKGIRAGDHLS